MKRDRKRRLDEPGTSLIDRVRKNAKVLNECVVFLKNLLKSTQTKSSENEVNVSLFDKDLAFLQDILAMDKELGAINARDLDLHALLGAIYALILEPEMKKKLNLFILKKLDPIQQLKESDPNRYNIFLSRLRTLAVNNNQVDIPVAIIEHVNMLMQNLTASSEPVDDMQNRWLHIIRTIGIQEKIWPSSIVARIFFICVSDERDPICGLSINEPASDDDHFIYRCDNINCPAKYHAACVDYFKINACMKCKHPLTVKFPRDDRKKK
nr:hypothetical protein [Candidatus Sigynarchaeota archaeon]